MFSKSTEYALRAVIYIAQKSSVQHKLGMDEISNAIGSPRSFTAKILQLLTKDNKIISATRGPNGGFYITDKAKRLPVRVIIEAMGEDGILKNCILGLAECSEVNPCPLHSKYKIIKRQLATLFDGSTIQRLADDTNNGASIINLVSSAE
jgi:Rrf2 family iron-sulfur cluster assembly transcriptional regulator